MTANIVIASQSSSSFGRLAVNDQALVIESVETVREGRRIVEVLQQSEASSPCEIYNDDYLLSLGVHERCLPTLRRVCDDDLVMSRSGRPSRFIKPFVGTSGGGMR